MKSKYLNIGLGVILLGVIGFFAYSYSQNKNTTTESTTNSNTETAININQANANQEAAEPEPVLPTAPNGWKTYEKNGLHFAYPTYLQPIGKTSANSALGTYDKPVKGMYAGQYVLVVTTSAEQTQSAKSYFNEYYGQALASRTAAEQFLHNAEGPAAACYKLATTQQGLKSVACIGEGGAAFYGLLEQNGKVLFIDGYSRGFATDDSINFVELKDADLSKFLETIYLSK